MSSSSFPRFDLKVEKDFGIQLSESQLRLHQRKLLNAGRQSLGMHVHVGGGSSNISSSRDARNDSDADTKNEIENEASHHQPLAHSESASTISTADGNEENSKEMLRKVLNSSKKDKAPSSVSIASTADQKARLRKILAQKAGRSSKNPKQELTAPVPSPAPAPASSSLVNQPKRQLQTSSASSKVSTPHRQPMSFPSPLPPRSVATSLPAENKEDDQKALLRKILAKSSARRQSAAFGQPETPSGSKKTITQHQDREPLTPVVKQEVTAIAPAPLPVRRPSMSKSSFPASLQTSAFKERRPSLAGSNERRPSLAATSLKPQLHVATKMDDAADVQAQAPSRHHPIKGGLKRDTVVKKVGRKISPRSRVLQSMAAKRESMGQRKPTPKGDATEAFAKKQFADPRKGENALTSISGSDAQTSGARQSETVKNYAASRSLFASRRPSLSKAKVAKDPVKNRVTRAFDRISPKKLKIPPPDEDLESYQVFFGTLQKEVSSDHKDLWRSFRSLFHQGCVSVDEKKKRVKFDSKTKKQLTEMNLHLKRNTQMECKPVTQLVNDKKYRRGEMGLKKKQTSKLDPDSLKEYELATSFGRSMSSESEAHASDARSDVHSEASHRSHQPPPPPSEMDRQKSWLATFREKNKQAAAAKREAIPAPEPTREPPWLAIHRQRKERAKQTALHTEVEAQNEDDEMEQDENAGSVNEDYNYESPRSIAGQKRRIVGEKNSVPWAAVRLRSTRAAHTESEEHEVGSIPWSKVQLRGTRSTVADESSIEPEDESDSRGEEVEAQHTHTYETSDDRHIAESAQKSAAFVGRTTYTKPPLVQSFVPVSSSNTTGIPWNKVKLKHGGSASIAESSCERSKGAAPWGQVKLKRRQPPKIEKPFDQGAAFLQVLKKTPSFGDVELHERNAENSENDESACPPSIRQTQSFAGEQLAQHRYEENAELEHENSRVHWGEPKSYLEAGETCSVDVQKSLSQMLAARSALPAHVPSPKRMEITAEGRLGKPSSSELKSVLSNMLSSRKAQDPDTSLAPDSPQKPSQSDIQGALANMFAARQVTPKTQKGAIIKVGDEVDLDDLPSALQQKLGDFDVVELASIEKAVVIGIDLILIITPVGAGFSKRVEWYHERDGIESITLDLACNVAELQLSDRSQKSLRFRNAEGCLRFATCFYQGPTAAPTMTHPEVPTEFLSPAHGSVDSSGNNEHLSQEEQEVLMRYRAARKIKGPNDAMEETIGGGPQHATTDLSPEEIAAVEKYRKMLKMQIPPEAVQHKMTKDGVDQKVVDIVLSGDQGTQAPSATGLTPEEEEIADSYRKMLKMRIPPEAVQHKMTKDGANQNIVDAVFPKETMASIPTVKEAEKPKITLSEAETKLVASYQKMLKMCIPVEAVRHKMKKDQASSNVIYTVFPDDRKQTTEATVATEKPSLTPEESQIASSYEKMLKMRIPPEAVRHKMLKDGVAANIVAVVLGEDTPKAKPGNGLSEDEEKAVSAYKKMLKMNLPEEAVRHRMAKEGASDKVMLAVFGNKKKSETEASKAAALRGSKLVALHWTPLSGEELDDSVWRANKKRKVAVPQPGKTDISQLIELFKKKSNPKGGAVAAAGKTSDSDGKAKLIDLTRANNVAISLKAFKDFSHKQLAETIAYLDPQEQIKGERVQFMKDLLPNLGEVKEIKAYKGEDSRLVPAELFFKHIVAVKRIEAKVEIMQSMVAFRPNAEELEQSFLVLQRACLQVQSSEKLQDVLDMVLHVGNIMNEGTRTGGAAGFKFDSLLKLTQTKSADGKTTVLDYLVMIFVAKNKRDTLDLKGDFPDCQAGSRILVSDLNAEVKSMMDTVNQCKKELAQLKKENSSKDDNNSLQKAHTPMDPRSALFAAIQARGTQDETTAGSRPERAPVNSYLDAIKTKHDEAEAKSDNEAKKPGKLNIDAIKEKCNLKDEKQSVSMLDAITSCTNPDLKSVDQAEYKEAEQPSSPEKPKREASLAGGISRLEDFIDEAEQTLARVKKGKEAALNACKSLSKYCGEGGSEKAATTLLGILSQFASNLSDAVKKHDRRKELEAKREAQKQKRKTFVESKGFGTINDVGIRGAKAEPAKQGNGKQDPSPSNLPSKENDDAHQPQGVVSVSETPATEVEENYRNQNDGEIVVDVSQIQQNAKAKVVPKAKDGSSLVLMVNQMLKEASPRAKQDFEKGVVYEDIEDETLQAIYQKERESIASYLSPPRRKRVSTNLDILSAIKQRREAGD